MSIIICICKLSLFFYLFHSLYCLVFDKEHKVLKVLYVVVCVEEIFRIINSHFNFIFDLPTKCNIFLGILVLCTIPEIVEKRKILYLIYLLIIGYNIYYNYTFAPNIEIYTMGTITVVEVTKYIVKFVSMALINSVLIKRISTDCK